MCAYGCQGQEAQAHSAESAGGQPWQTSAQRPRAHPAEGRTEVPVVAPARGQKGMEAPGVLTGGDGRFDHGRPDGLRGVLSGVCPLEGSRGVHHAARQHLQNAFRLCAAGAAGQHRPAEPEDHAVFLLGLWLDARYPRTHHRRRQRHGGRLGRPHGKAAEGRLAG